MAARVLLIAAAWLAFAATACGGGDGAREGEIGGRITVFAAASLTDAFQEIGAGFKARYPGTDVRFNFAGTPTLRLQLEQGARADVFASADIAQMELALQGGVVEAPLTFARNSLVVIVPAANPGGVDSPADLARPGLKLVLANQEVPAGAYSAQVLRNLEAGGGYGADFAERVLANVVSRESNVKQVVARVELGEADGGLVYGSDVTASVAADLKVISIPERFNVTASYPIAVVRDSGNAATARAFIDYVVSPAGQGILARHGFLTAE
jgi:molybdate transport system substrate-binding protein